MVYKRGVNKSDIPTVPILGVHIAAIDMPWLLNFTKNHIKDLSGDYICVSNVHTTVMASEDEEYRIIQNGGVMAIPDGGPLSSIGRIRGAENMERTTGPSYMGEMLKLGGFRHYFYGSTPETLEKLYENLTHDFPQSTIVGMYSPPFRPLTDEEDAQIVAKINDVAPDFLWVGLGAPKQEKWMASHKGRVSGLMVGVGAAFDYYARNIERAPRWMQKSNLEWFYRLLQDPKRLFMRYMVTNTKFVWNAIIRGK